MEILEGYLDISEAAEKGELSPEGMELFENINAEIYRLGGQH